MSYSINIFEVLYILLFHWFADFVCQTDKQAIGKSKNIDDLLSHTINYSCIMWIGIGVLSIINDICFGQSISLMPVAFGVITFVFHTIQDYITSRINSRLLEQNKTHLFFVSIGLDQLLHFIQLLLTYQLLTN